ncbi:hypothetical protein Acr_29g0005200 [Actinidia rufa]|uniref:Transposase (putative) gypsy type domain-containing protein n=1 Tax=Actinidia rufa TaxID=165716 RepID=A0A7J0HE68_9ERIC|nr:hypothetical protein Acr_29g0005200 [Actinidia rufa]
MDTSNLIKEVNIMTQGSPERVISTRPSEVTFYEAAFPSDLRFPIHPIIRMTLNHYKICPAQLSPNVWRSIICSLVIRRYYKCHMSCDNFRCLYSLSPLPDSGWYYFKAMPDKNLLRGPLSSVKRWKKRFFFASRDEWEFFPSMPLSKGIPTRLRGRTEILEKIESGGYFEVSKVLDSKTSQKYFACGRMEISSSSGKNTTSGDEGTIARKAFLDTPDLPLLRWLRGKVQDPFLNLFPNSLSSSSNLKSKSLSDSGLFPMLRSDGQGGHATTPPKRTKSNKGASNAAVRMSPLGTPFTLPGDNLGPEASMMLSVPMAWKILNEVIFPINKEKVDQFTTDELVTKSFHALGQAVVLVSALALQSQDHQNDYHFQLTRANLAELKMDVVIDFAATYFGEGKRQLLHHHPNLGIDLASMGMDADLGEKEEEARQAKRRRIMKAKPTTLINVVKLFFGNDDL